VPKDPQLVARVLIRTKCTSLLPRIAERIWPAINHLQNSEDRSLYRYRVGQRALRARHRCRSIIHTSWSGHYVRRTKYLARTSIHSDRQNIGLFSEISLFASYCIPYHFLWTPITMTFNSDKFLKYDSSMFAEFEY